MSVDSSGDAAIRRRRRVKVAIAIVAAVVVGALGAGGAALALGWVSPFAAPVPSAAAASTPSAAPTPSANPTPPPNPVTAPVRVPLSCDALLPESTAEALVGTDLSAPSSSAPDPLSSANERAGSLTCRWYSVEEAAPGTFTPMMSLTIVPDVSAEDFQATSRGIDLGGSAPIPGFSVESRELCTLGTSFAVCSLVDRIGDYGVSLALVPASQNIAEDDVAAARQTFATIADAVSTAGAPGPLWEPTGPNLAGASSCDGLITEQQLGGIVGDPTMSNYRTAEGEFSIATFRSNAQVGGFACGWSGQGAGIWASVLPGGAAYFAGSAPLGGGSWTPTSGYPGEAYVSDAGDQASVLVDNAWFLVRVPAEQVGYLPEIVAALVENVQAAG